MRGGGRHDQGRGSDQTIDFKIPHPLLVHGNGTCSEGLAEGFGYLSWSNGSSFS
jgi:hypothetical protein